MTHLRKEEKESFLTISKIKINFYEKIRYEKWESLDTTQNSPSNTRFGRPEIFSPRAACSGENLERTYLKRCVLSFF